MKNSLKVIIFLVFVIFVSITCCFIFIPDVPKFKESSEYKYLIYNENNLESVVVRTVTLLGERCYKIDKEKGYDILNGISFKKKTNMTCTDSDMYMEFNFKNENKCILSFECGNLIYRDEKYKLKNEVILYNEDEFVPGKIKSGMIVISDDDMIECK